MTKLLFVTGNKDKVNYAKRILAIDVAYHDYDLEEIQSVDPVAIVEHKVRQAYDLCQCPVIVEDVGLRFEAFGSLPGPFIKFFIKEDDGLEKLCRMLDSFPSRRATGYSVIGYYDGKNFAHFYGELRGTIASSPRIGSVGYGWDGIFCFDGYDDRASTELTPEEYDEIYRIIRPFDKLKLYIEHQDKKARE